LSYYDDMIERLLEKTILEKLPKGKIIVLVGPRQVGKTTLLKSVLQKSGKRALFWNCDEPDIREILQNATSTRLKNLAGNAELIIIDEAQRIKDIGITIKLMADNFAGVQIAVTGSSALELSNSINEPLTGRKYEYMLFPLSCGELCSYYGTLEETRLLKDRLIYGTYPEIVTKPEEKRELLGNIVSSYLFKDVFVFQDIRKSDTVEKMLQALALQVGSEVSFNELAGLLSIDPATVRRYVDLMEKACIIFHLSSFSKNVRNELKKSIKIYFYDNGVRNALISNFNPIELRTDAGALWENYLISERIKHNQYSGSYAKSYFWRTTQQQEIDYIEEFNEKLIAWEFKYKTGKTARMPLTFSHNYPGTEFSVITPENYIEFTNGR
jgi:uncharacterized protein